MLNNVHQNTTNSFRVQRITAFHASTTMCHQLLSSIMKDPQRSIKNLQTLPKSRIRQSIGGIMLLISIISALQPSHGLCTCLSQELVKDVLPGEFAEQPLGWFQSILTRQSECFPVLCFKPLNHNFKSFADGGLEQWIRHPPVWQGAISEKTF